MEMYISSARHPDLAEYQTMQETSNPAAPAPADHSGEQYHPDQSAETQPDSTDEFETYEVAVIDGEELDPEQFQSQLQDEESDSVVRVVAHKEQTDTGARLRNGNCCFMRTIARLYSNGTLAADTYMNHYCMVGKFSARTHVKIMAGPRVLEVFRSGEYTTAGERQDGWGETVRLHTPDYINQNVTHLEIYHEVTYNGW